jgi:hypothetical protein
MKLSKPALVITAAIVFLAAGPVQAQDHAARAAKTSSVRLGDQVIVIPDPEGFEEAASQFANFKTRIDATEAPQNEALLGFLPVSDCELLRKGAPATLDFYTKVSVLRAARELRVSRADLAAAVADLRKNAGAILDPNGRHMKELDRSIEDRLSAVESKQTTIDFVGKPQMLGEFDTQPNLNSFLSFITYKVAVAGAEKTFSVLVTTSLVLVKERIVFVYAFRKYESKADVDPLKVFTKKWTSSIIAAN